MNTRGASTPSALAAAYGALTGFHMLMIKVLVGSARAKDPLRAIVPLGKPFGDLEPEDAAYGGCCLH